MQLIVCGEFPIRLFAASLINCSCCVVLLLGIGKVPSSTDRLNGDDDDDDDGSCASDRQSAFGMSQSN